MTPNIKPIPAILIMCMFVIVITIAYTLATNETTIWINDEVRSKNLTNANPNISYHPFVIGMGKGKAAELGFLSLENIYEMLSLCHKDEHR